MWTAELIEEARRHHGLALSVGAGNVAVNASSALATNTTLFATRSEISALGAAAVSFLKHSANNTFVAAVLPMGMDLTHVVILEVVLVVVFLTCIVGYFGCYNGTILRGSVEEAVVDDSKYPKERDVDESAVQSHTKAVPQHYARSSRRCPGLCSVDGPSGWGNGQ